MYVYVYTSCGCVGGSSRHARRASCGTLLDSAMRCPRFIIPRAYYIIIYGASLAFDDPTDNDNDSGNNNNKNKNYLKKRKKKKMTKTTTTDKYNELVAT